MARPSVAAIGNAVVASANIVVDIANTVSTSTSALTNLADAGATISKNYADNVKFRAKAESFDNREAIKDEVVLTSAKRKAKLADELSKDEVLEQAFKEQQEALTAFLAN